MGSETQCEVRYRGASCEGKALLETNELLFRGKPVRLKIPFDEIDEISAEEGVLHLSWKDEQVELVLGKLAAKWVMKITNPRTLVDKLGVKSGMRVSVIRLRDETLRMMLESRDVEIHEGRGAKDSDIVFVGAESREELSDFQAIRDLLKPKGAIWVVRPKGTASISDADVRAAAKLAGLVDVKVAAYSERLTAEKLVIRREGR